MREVLNSALVSVSLVGFLPPTVFCRPLVVLFVVAFVIICFIEGVDDE